MLLLPQLKVVEAEDAAVGVAAEGGTAIEDGAAMEVVVAVVAAVEGGAAVEVVVDSAPPRGERCCFAVERGAPETTEN